MNNLHDQLSNLSSKNFQFLLKKLEAKKSTSDTKEKILTKYPLRDKPIPLSFAQERLWFLAQLEGLSATYNMPAAMRLRGSLDFSALQQALAEIVHRHEVFRTSFANSNGIPMQVIHPTANTNMEIVDLQHLEESERRLVLEQQLQQLTVSPFDLEIAPLIRYRLWQLSDSDYVFGINMHHIVSDGWSIGVLIRELSVLYKAFYAGAPSPLLELPIQYADFALWQRQWLSGAVLEKQLQYWISQLQGIPELLQFPTNRPRPSVQNYRGKTQSFKLDRELTHKLEILSQRTNSTLFMTLLAAYATLLYRYSGQDDIVIGSPIANRNRSEIAPLIGFFVNTLVLRTRLENNPNFEQVLAQVRENTLQAYEHQDVPFEQVVEALQPQRSMSYAPLFQVMFSLQNTPMGEVELPKVKLSMLNQKSTVAKFDLTLSIIETPLGLNCEWEYNTDLFDKSTIERMANHFENLLVAIVENPQQKVSELPLLSEAERHQLLVEWNDTQTDYPEDKCIHQLFEQQVAKTPDATAVVFEEQQLTYQQLNQKANQLAHYLQTLGVEPEVLVGICVERSVEMVVGLLGILKAGGAYVPLDPSYPNERLGYMLNDAGVKVLLTQNNLLPELPSHAAQIVCLDTDLKIIESHGQENLMTDVGADNLAYVIYTSGSTGQPKGVAIEHRSVVNFLNYMGYVPGLSQEDTFSAITTISFDIAALELYLPLIVGAKVIVTSHKIATDANRLLPELRESKTTVVQATPPTWQMLLAEGWSSNYSLKVLCGGEALPKRLAHQILETASELWNLYGPTEATIWSTLEQVTEITTENTSSTIGRPIANAQIYILDWQMQPVPIGVAGELHIGGHGLARGYLNRPELTAEKFIDNPFSEEKTARLYKTGDLARYLPDGNIEFLGRIDNQVKIRGFRIELGEIEAVLSNYPDVQQAVVIASEEPAGTKRLVAYVVSEEEELNRQQLREFLQERLPGYMVPVVFITLERLPLTPNGKIDRKVLPTADSYFSQQETLILPRNTTELQLAQIWSNILNVNPVGVTNNFFELGGHSLAAAVLMSEIKQQFQRDLPLATLFQSPTIKQLATLIHSSTDSLSWPTLVAIKPNGDRLPLFCVHPAGGNVLRYQNLAYCLSSEQPFYGLEFTGLNPQSEPHTSVEQMATHYIQEIKTVQPYGPYFLSGWSLGGLIAFEMAQQLTAQGEKIAFLGLLDAYPFSVQELEPQDDISVIEGGLIARDLDLNLEELRSLEGDGLLTYMVSKAKQRNMIPEYFDLAQARHLLMIQRLNTQAGVNYKPQYFPGSITLFQASIIDVQPELGWDKLAQDIETVLVPGDHYSMVDPPHVEILAQLIQESLERASQRYLD